MRNGNLIQLCSGRYYQGSGVLSHLGGDAVLLGRRALVVADAAVWPKVEARVLRSLEQSGVDTKIWLFSGHCCPGNVRSAAQAGQAYGAELVGGVGGGRALDTAKIAADHMGVRAITVPTSAATCAASAWLAVEYTDEGAFVGNNWTRYPPFAVIAELDFIVRDCPARLCAAGIVDAMAKYPEISYNIQFSNQWEKNLFSQSAQLLSENTYRLLLEHGCETIEQLRAGKITPALEDCVCAALQVTGVISAMACGGKQAAVSHTLYSYFCCVHPELAAGFLHGELVGSTLVYQLGGKRGPKGSAGGAEPGAAGAGYAHLSGGAGPEGDSGGSRPDFRLPGGTHAGGDAERTPAPAWGERCFVPRPAGQRRETANEKRRSP